ncbi:MAG: YraN family protein [Alphaproteobacteria bacterium]|jgi:putative endonuclease
MLSTYKFGVIAEYLSVLILKLKMYKIIAIRHRNYFGEIDIIALRNNVIAFIEVKARASDVGYDLVQQKQIKRIRNAASLFLANHPKYQSKDVRFDLIVIIGISCPKHLQNI